MVGLFPRFNDGERRLVSGLSTAETRQLGRLLRKVLRTIHGLDAPAAELSRAAVDAVDR
jgi:hypothetical protein